MVRYSNPADHNPRRIRKANTYFAKRLEKKIPISISVFGYENKEKYPIYVSKKCYKEKHADLLFIRKGQKNTTFLSMISKDSCMIVHYIVEENILSILFTHFHYKRSIEASY